MDYVKQVEKNVVNIARKFDDMLEITQALSKFGNVACNEHVGKDKFFKGLALMQDALYQEQSNALAKCFLFAGIGGEEAAKYSREECEKTFGDHAHSVMHFLAEWGNRPAAYKDTTDKEIRDTFQEKLKVTEKNPLIYHEQTKGYA